MINKDQINKENRIFAMPGKRFDNSYEIAKQAALNGAKTIFAWKYVCDQLANQFPSTIFVPSNNPRYDQTLFWKKKLYPVKEHIFVGITGSKGKTSVAFMLHNNLPFAAYIGTIGVYVQGVCVAKTNLTTPEPKQLYGIFRLIKQEFPHITHIIFEYSSIGLDAYRCIEPLDLGLFTNFSPDDHLIYHHTVENYKACKDMLKNYAKTVLFGYKKANFVEQNIDLVQRALEFLNVYLNTQKVINTYVPARMEEIAPNIFLDYAHTPLSLESALKYLRQYKTIIVVFGCGGERDHQKRDKMGAIAYKLAHHTIITDDNPRNEDASYIRQIIINACPNAVEIPNRKDAIKYGFALKNKYTENKSNYQCALLIAGKGDETFQIIGTQHIPFSDRAVIEELTKNKE